MIKRWQILTLCLVLSLGLIWLGRALRKIANKTDSFEDFLPTNIPSKIIPSPLQQGMTGLKVDGRKVIGPPPPYSVKKKSYILSNHTSPEWREGLEEVLLAQAPDLKELKISRLDSFIWSVGGQATNVESVLVSFKSDSGQSTKFNALVDSQTGKILQSWNHPIIDSLNPRETFGIKLDPRYHQD
jgi:hypothetical protein